MNFRIVYVHNKGVIVIWIDMVGPYGPYCSLLQQKFQVSLGRTRIGEGEGVYFSFYFLKFTFFVIF